MYEDDDIDEEPPWVDDEPARELMLHEIAARRAAAFILLAAAHNAPLRGVADLMDDAAQIWPEPPPLSPGDIPPGSPLSCWDRALELIAQARDFQAKASA